MIFADWIYLYIALGSIIFIFLLFIRAQRLRKKALASFISTKLFKQLSYNHSRFATYSKFLILILGIAFVFIALARPQWGFTWQETKSKGTDIIFAIDCSKSMLSQDLKPNRIERAKLAIEDALSYIEGDRVGIVAFSGIAFLQCPLTLDYSAFKMSLKDIDTNLIDRGGTNISAAILEAESAFKASSGAKNIILLSDGQELEEDAITKAKDLAKEGIKIYTIGVGDTKLRPLSYTDKYGKTHTLKDSKGNVVETQLDETRLMEIADAGGAFYSRLDANGMQRAIEEIQKEKYELSSKMKQSAIERFQIFLAIALVLLCLESLIGTRKLFAKKLKNIALNNLNSIAIFALCLIALSPSLKAQEAPRDTFNKAVSAEQEGDIESAKNLYKKAIFEEEEDMLLHAKVHYNLANIDYALARQAYEAIEDISEILQATDSSLSDYDNAKKQGEEILKEGNYRLINDLANSTDNLGEQSFQDALKQAKSYLENTQKTFEEFEKAKKTKLNALEAPKKQLEEIEKLYTSAQKLAPAESNINANLESAKLAKNIINKDITDLEYFAKNAENTFKDCREKLPAIIEGIKKLIKEDENQDQQDNQDSQENQENQDNQQSQDNQSQDSQSQDSQSQQDKSQENQQNQEQNQNQEQSQDNQSQDSQNQDSQSQQDKSQENQQNQEQSQDNQSQDSQSQDSQSQDQQNSQEQNQQSQDNQSKQNNQQSKADEQAVDNREQSSKEENQGEEENQGQAQQEQNSQQASEEQASKEQGESPQEQAVSQEEQGGSQATQGSQEEAKEEASQDFRMREGAMTKREAIQLIEASDTKGKHLPFKGFGTSTERYNQNNYKDW